jgi:hypothetical protein
VGSGFARNVTPPHWIFSELYQCITLLAGRVTLGSDLTELPVAGAFVRSAIAILGGLASSQLSGVFLSVGLGMAAFSGVGLASLIGKAGYRSLAQSA